MIAPDTRPVALIGAPTDAGAGRRGGSMGPEALRVAGIGPAIRRLGRTVDAVVVDIHGEATSEKMAMGRVVDGRASLAVGTHTHVPTADAMILGGGTGYLTDAGMCGDYDSVIGMAPDIPITRFVRKMPTGRLSPASGEGTLCAVLVETDDATGLARNLAPLRTGGKLAEAWPDF